MGREFLYVFENWADSYDLTVNGHDEEYKDVFFRYEEILNAVVEKSGVSVLEFGVGTGNLTEKLVNSGRSVIGIEPSRQMRELAEKKLAGYEVSLFDGDFLTFPLPNKLVDTIVSTYAFHHLTDSEKYEAFNQYSMFIPKGGKIIFADTMFMDKDSHKLTIESAKHKSFLNLAKDLETEYYTTIDVLRDIAEKNGFSVTFTRFNHFVWVMEAIKQ